MQHDSIRRRTVNLIRAFHLINPNYAWRRGIATGLVLDSRDINLSLSLSFSLVPHARSTRSFHTLLHLNAPLIREYPGSLGGPRAPQAR